MEGSLDVQKNKMGGRKKWLMKIKRKGRGEVSAPGILQMKRCGQEGWWLWTFRECSFWPLRLSRLL